MGGMVKGLPRHPAPVLPSPPYLVHAIRVLPSGLSGVLVFTTARLLLLRCARIRLSQPVQILSGSSRFPSSVSVYLVTCKKPAEWPRGGALPLTRAVTSRPPSLRHRPQKKKKRSGWPALPTPTHLASPSCHHIFSHPPRATRAALGSRVPAHRNASQWRGAHCGGLRQAP